MLHHYKLRAVREALAKQVLQTLTDQPLVTYHRVAELHGTSIDFVLDVAKANSISRSRGRKPQREK
jgi:hypothetical protein